MKTIFFLTLIIITVPLVVQATEPNVVINEIAWMGTEVSANGEWLELKNNTNAEIDLTNWRLEADDGSPKISLVGTIEVNGFFILERTSDDTLPLITASQIYTGALSNTGEWLKLYDSQNNIIDQINAAEAWPAGDNLTKQTLERITTDSWQTSTSSGRRRAEMASAICWGSPASSAWGANEIPE